MVRKIQNKRIRTNDTHSVFYGLSIALFFFLKQVWSAKKRMHFWNQRK